jgi:hypothetical protein
MTESNAEKPDYTPWYECKGYVFRRHMLAKASLSNGRIVASACEATKAVDCSEALSWIYELLSALDSKASALMRLNGVMLAAAAFLLTMHGSAYQSVLRVTNIDVGIISGTAALCSFSILLCLLVVNVKWYFLGKVTENGEQLDYTDEFQMLQRVAKSRQTYYRIAWEVSRVAAVLFVVEFARQFLFAVSGRSPW